MKRTIKNIIMILIIVAMGVCSYFTMKDVKEIQTSNMNQPTGMQQGGAPGGQNNNNNNGGQQPEMPSNDNSNNDNQSEPPAKPDDSTSSNNSGTQQTPPAKPEENSNSTSSDTTTSTTDNNAQTQDNSKQSENSMQAPQEMPEMNQENAGTQFRTIHYIMFTIEGLAIAIILIYLIMSKFNKLTLVETLSNPQRIIIFVLVAIILTAGLIFTQTCVSKKFFANNNTNTQMMQGDGGDSSSASVNQTGETEVDATETTLTESYSTTESDKSSILVKNGGNLTLDGAEITKTGDSTNTENSEFYGVNSGILVTKNSTATIRNAKISTNAKGSNAVFATGTDSKIYISDSTITTTGSGSARGLDATYGGYIEADNVNIKTQGGSCATLATDRGEGTVIAKNSTLETNGTGSPVIYSTGDISISNTTGTANSSQMVVIEGKNSATVENSTLTASGTGNRGTTDQSGIMIYQSMSGDAGEGTGTFTGKNSSLSINSNSKYYKTAPMFFVTNTDAVVNLDNCKLSYGSGTLVSCKGTSEWGTSGSNGGNLTINAENQTLEGNIEADKISTVTMNLSKSSYTGTINADNTAKQITLKIDAQSKITLTGDTYVTSLEDADTTYSNINFNGHKLYVNGTAIN